MPTKVFEVGTQKGPGTHPKGAPRYEAGGGLGSQKRLRYVPRRGLRYVPRRGLRYVPRRGLRYVRTQKGTEVRTQKDGGRDVEEDLEKPGAAAHVALSASPMRESEEKE